MLFFKGSAFNNVLVCCDLDFKDTPGRERKLACCVVIKGLRKAYPIFSFCGDSYEDVFYACG